MLFRRIHECGMTPFLADVKLWDDDDDNQNDDETAEQGSEDKGSMQ